MSSNIRGRIRDEAELIQRFTDSYGKQFHLLIDRINANPAESDPQSIRLCVEAVNMVLSLQGRLAGVLDDLSSAN
jgi:hypothetical protein